MKTLRAYWHSTLGLFLPPVCEVCTERVEDRLHFFCAACLDDVPWLEPPFCQQCAMPFPAETGAEFTCSNCLGRQMAVDFAVASCRSRGFVRNLIHRYKYNRQRYLHHALALLLISALEDERLAAAEWHAIVPVPLHPARQREREFNQAEPLAAAVAKELNLPVLHALRRVRPTATQTALDREERMENLHGAFKTAKNTDVRTMNLLLIDDVLTTGATVDLCAAELKQAGANAVAAVTVARAC